MARSRSRIDRTPFQTEILDLSHDGRGVARREGEGGKVTFVSGALPGEVVMAEPTARNRHFDEARTVEVLQPSPQRVTPKCPHFGTCAGCVLQHLDEGQQIVAKQRVLMDNLERIGHVKPGAVLPPLFGESWGYRRKGRFSVRRVEKKDKTLVGFREQDPRFVADLSQCLTVIPEIGTKVEALSTFIESLDGKRDIPQIEFIAGDQAVVLTVRHMQPLSDADRAAWAAFGQQHGFVIYLQSGGVDTVQPLDGQGVPLSFRLAPWDVELAFRPLDFIQVNAKLNEKMIAHALDLLEPGEDERVLDLFCGLGNFTLPLATRVRRVLATEISKTSVNAALANIEGNGIDNIELVRLSAEELTQALNEVRPFRRLTHIDLKSYDFGGIFVDPPRAGMDPDTCELTRRFERILYISCNPETLAQNIAQLADTHRIERCALFDQFPYTHHMESGVLLVRK